MKLRPGKHLYFTIVFSLVATLSGCGVNLMQRRPLKPGDTPGPSQANTTHKGVDGAGASGSRDGQTHGSQTHPDRVRFVDAATTAGLNYRWVINGKRPLNILQTIGNGCAFLDYNNDGNLDLLLVGTQPTLYQGTGKGRFSDVTRRMGLSKLSGHYLGCGVGDYDNDGYSDIYVSGYRSGTLLHNRGGQGYQDVTRAAGVQVQPWGTSCAWADVDDDGYLDLFIGNYVQFGPNTKPQLCDKNGRMTACGPLYYKPLKGVLYRNTGRGNFKDVTTAWSAHKTAGNVLGVAYADYNRSGRLSLACANDETPGDLLLNLGGRFKNVGPDSGTAYDSQGKNHAGMGIDWGDYDNDGQLDLAVATFSDEPKCVYHNDSSNFFTEKSMELGINKPTLPYVAFGLKWLDYNNDGWLDLMLANGHVEDNVTDASGTSTYRQPTQLFRNEDGQSFTDVSQQAGADLKKPIVGRGLAVGDYDNDGRVDALVVDSEDKPLLLHNASAPVGHWLLVGLEGTLSNRDGYGAQVTVEAAGRKLLRQCATDGSYLSASDKRVHFGLGNATSVTLTVHWPSGRSSTYQNVPVDRVVMIREGAPRVRVRS